MEFQVLKYCIKTFLLSALLVLGTSCEEEIKVDLPPAEHQLVVEACINDTVLSLNYVFLSQTVDYFNPDLSLIGISDAEVYITEGEVIGKDTVYNPNRRVQFRSIEVPNYPSGVYLNPGFLGEVGKIYKLDVSYQGKYIYGTTKIPSKAAIISTSVEVENGTQNDEERGRLKFRFFDPPGPNYYRIATTVNKLPFLLGFGEAYQTRRTDDSFIDNAEREYDLGRSFTLGDTVNIYLCSLGPKEFRFWESFAAAQSNGGPFSTPVQLMSNVQGAIGSFTGYSISFRQQIIKP